MTLREFFDNYPELSQKSEPKGLAAPYAPTFYLSLNEERPHLRVDGRQPDRWKE
jgi:hypothetical protein